MHLHPNLNMIKSDINTQIYPAKGTGELFQLGRSQSYCAVITSAGRINHIEPFQRFIQINGHAIGNSKRTYAANLMTDHGSNLLPGEHFCFFMKERLVFGAVGLLISCADDHYRPICHKKRQRFGDSCRLRTNRSRCKFYGSAGYCKHLDSF